MTRPISVLLRNLVLVALAPASFACGGTTASSGSALGTGLPEAGPDGSPPGDGGEPDAGADGAPDCGGPTLEAGLEYAASCCSRPTGDVCCHGNVCDPSALPFPVGDAGACAPRWLNGDGCIGGDVSYPCGTGEPLVIGNCDVCGVGTPLNACLVLSPDGGPLDFYDAGDFPVVVRCWTDCTGRRPAGLAESRHEFRSAGDVLARAAYLEAASVDAFLRLADELARYGAPPALLRRLRDAAGDEVRHARDVGALARARGVTPADVQIDPAEERTLFDIALENAREGCVRETWGAACAVVQAERAEDLDVRRVMRGIANDELEHAGIAWDLAAWLDARLSARERLAVADERRRAVSALMKEIDLEAPASWARRLGLPSAAEARAMFSAVNGGLWAREQAA